MGKEPIRSFEELDVYKLAREFSRKVSELIKILPENENYRLKGQMKRAKLSVTNNIAEGYGRYHYQENIQFCRQSRGSVCELIDDFNECYDERYIDEKYLSSLKQDAYHLIKVLNGYIASIKRQKQKITQ
ncbi:MAG: four helix bundle protein [bacterium (Candidatus Stahlbacteria) CG23_combo_of_CG06-09_8_20_14_all_40_9]|nr:MAG: four helix bundle protein [bacterium (Candidatus Stahlbacteria) CG23_combo_of_CG06-09_8_20_14_all_40_9]